MPTLVSDPGLETSTSYASLAEATAYFDGSPYADVWFDAGEDQQAWALNTASKQLDTWFDWQGAIRDLNQALLWPRTGVLRPGVAQGQTTVDVTSPWGVPFGGMLDPDAIPAIIRDAACEYALQLLTSNRLADSDIETQGIRSLSAGPVSLTFAGNVEAKPIPDVVMAMCSQLGTPRSKSSSAAGVSVLRG